MASLPLPPPTARPWAAVGDSFTWTHNQYPSSACDGIVYSKHEKYKDLDVLCFCGSRKSSIDSGNGGSSCYTMFEPAVPRAEVKRADRLQGRKVVVLLEDAVLELAKGRQGSLQLLEGLQHRKLLQQEDRDSTDVRPDIVHHCLLALQESPLNKAGRLCVFIRTRDRQLIEVHPQLRVPSTYEEFRKLMAQITKNDPNLFLPVGSRKIAFSSKGRPVDLEEFVQQFQHTENPVLFLVGAVAHANPTANSELAEECISIAPCGLSAAVRTALPMKKLHSTLNP
ncbi:nucleolar essential protein 1, putative [Eimeria praecox]|uniref:Nucleolar essential protein 1, putative n=1 Tax=Eimeria praecox TaxID=51316 RepID=U6G838_9EIME|nr:nucleolar essential protein 1, putative [Eimeria praecox]